MSSGLQLICRKAIIHAANDVGGWLLGYATITNSSREKGFSPKSGLPSTSEQSSTVVRCLYQLERRSCSGVSRPVPGDDDSISSRSGSILPSVLSSIQERTPNEILEQHSRGLEGWESTVPIGATIAGAAARPLLSIKLRSNLSIFPSV